LNSISAYSYDGTVDNDILCMLNINDANNDLMTVTVHWYKNGIFDRAVTLYNQKSGDVVEPLSKSQLSAGDTWQCRAKVYDGKDYSSWSQSNILTIETPTTNKPKPKSSGGGGGGGGGGSGSTSPIIVSDTPVVVVEEPIVEEPAQFEEPVQEDASIAITTQSVDIPQEPVHENNSITGDVVLEDNQPNGYMFIFFGLMISGILVFVGRKKISTQFLQQSISKMPEVLDDISSKANKIILLVKNGLIIPIDQKALYYILKKLNDGYSYEAIGEVLKKKGYSERFINHHTKVLQANGHQPFIKYPGPQKYSIPQSKKAKLMSDIQEYTRIHIHEGFKLDEIKQVLLYNGHPWDLIEDAIHG
jgi:hypothetical protein